MEKTDATPTVSNSVEDFSEYVDAEENISAPTELLAEFLYAVMIKDYEKALQYCTQILSYEPNNATVNEFRPLIEQKLEMLRKEELEDSSSESSLNCSSSTSGSSDNLHDINNEVRWEAGSSNYSSLESDDESYEISEIRRNNVLQSDVTNGNAKPNYSPSTAKDFIKNSNNKDLNKSATKTIITPKLLAHQTQTRVLKRNNADGQNNYISSLKNENPSPPLHSTRTTVLTNKSSLISVKGNNNSGTFAWFSSIQENIFGNKKKENPRWKNLVQNPKNTNHLAQRKKTQ